MKKYYIITNSSKDENLVITNSINDFLVNHGVETVKSKNYTKHVDKSYCYTNPCDVENDTDCVIVIGGDGTLIQAARDLRNMDIPLIGVNRGTLGYLTEIESNCVSETLQMLIDDNYKIESRMMLFGQIIRNGEVIADDIALNDIVFGRDGSLRVVNFKIFVNNEFLNYYSADGVIVTTPTGSTAYNLSAGGPILEPCANIIAITPICSHTLGSRSIVLSAESKIKIVICRDHQQESSETRAYFDGNSSFSLKDGDIIEISRSNLDTKIIKLNRMSFVEILHKKMN